MEITRHYREFNYASGNYETKTYTVDVYPRPSLDREYIKQLLFIEHHPNCTKKQTLLFLYGKIRNFSIFDNLAFNEMIHVTGKGKYAARLYSVTPTGYALLFEVIGVPDHICSSINDMIAMAKEVNSLDELDLSCTIKGCHDKFEQWTSREFIDSLRNIDFNGNRDFKRIFSRFIESNYPFRSEIAKRLRLDSLMDSMSLAL